MSEVSVQFYETWLYVVSDHKKTETVKNWLASSLSSSDASFSDVNKATTRKSKLPKPRMSENFNPRLSSGYAVFSDVGKGCR